MKRLLSTALDKFLAATPAQQESAVLFTAALLALIAVLVLR